MDPTTSERLRERKPTDGASPLSRDFLVKAQEVAGIGSWSLDLASHRVTWSPELYRIFGLTEDQFDGSVESSMQAIHPDDLPRVLEATRAALERHQAVPVEYRVVTPEGRVRIVDARGDFIYDESGAPVTMVGTVLDITDRRHAEAELRLLQSVTELFATADDVDSALRGMLALVCRTAGWDYGEVWIPRPEGSALQYAASWGVDDAELEQFRLASVGFELPPNVGMPGRVWSTSEPEWIPDVSAVDTPVLARAELAAGVGLRAALAVPVKAGTTVVAVLGFFLRKSRPEDERMLDLVSSVAGQIGALLARKQAEDRLRRSEAISHALLEAIPDMIYRLDRNGTYLDYIPASGMEPVVPAAGFLGMTVYDVLPADVAEATIEIVRRALETGNVEVSEFRASASRHHHYESRVVRCGENEVVAVIRDVTDRKHHELALKQTREELEQKVGERTPPSDSYELTFRELTVLHLIAQGKADKEIADVLGIRPLTASKHVTNILSKMQAASRTEAGVRAVREGIVS